MAGHAARKQSHTWDDYQTWGDDKRWEIIDGEAFDMSPAPGMRHQSAAGELFVKLKRHFRGKLCQVYVSPLDVKLSDNDVVQPDIVVVCDPSQITPSHIQGAPTLVVEILSPSTQVHDRMRKMPLYARSGVREVWLVSTDVRLVEVYVLDGASYLLNGTHSLGTSLRSRAFPDLRINLTRVFADLPDYDSPGMVRESAPSPYTTKPPRKRLPARRRKVLA